MGCDSDRRELRDAGAERIAVTIAVEPISRAEALAMRGRRAIDDISGTPSSEPT